MNMKETIRAGLLAILLLAPAVAIVQAQQPGPSKERAKPSAKITEEQAKKIALERIPGEVTDVAIEKDVFVDVETGKIVGTD